MLFRIDSAIFYNTLLILNPTSSNNSIVLRLAIIDLWRPCGNIKTTFRTQSDERQLFRIDFCFPFLHFPACARCYLREEQAQAGALQHRVFPAAAALSSLACVLLSMPVALIHHNVASCERQPGYV